MLSSGSGQPTIYFDEAVLPAMEKAGICHEDACQYANDGCTETVIAGKSAIVFWQYENGQNSGTYLVWRKRKIRVLSQFL